MKDFAKSIVCNSVTEKEFNTEADLRRWCMDHNYTYTPVGGGYYRLEDDKPGSKRPDLEAHVKAGNSKFGNALKYTNLEEAKKMCQQMNDSLAPDAALRHYRHVYEKDGAYYVMETGEAVAKGMKRVGNSKCGNAEVVKDGSVWVVLYAEGTKSKEFDSEAEAKKFAAQVGNSKVGNGITKFGTGTKVIADGHEAIVLKETVEQGPNGIPFGWVEIKWTEGPWKGQTDTQYDYDLKKKVGNSKVGNAKQVYSDSEITIYDDGTAEIDYFRGYTQKLKDVPSIVRDEISDLKIQISRLERVAKKAKEYMDKMK